jgi:hypothetical protein
MQDCGPTNGAIPRDTRLITSTQSPRRSLVRKKKQSPPTSTKATEPGPVSPNPPRGMTSKKHAATGPVPGSGHYKHHEILNDEFVSIQPPPTTSFPS